MNFENQTIIITGAAGKIGRVISESLANKGYNLLLSDINKIELNKLKKKISNNNTLFFAGDLTKSKIIRKFLNLGISRFKTIDSLVHCSYPKSKNFNNNLENIEQNSLKEDLYKQLGATILLCVKLIKVFLKQKKGKIILLSSIQGLGAPKFDHYKSLRMTSPISYSVIKSGIISITKYLAKYYGKKNISVNCISPGGIKDNQPKLFIKKYKKSCLIKGLLDSKDILPLINFLLSENSHYINGQNLIIDDGWSL
jgi:NAD(P)-dependent dehydrogenase (short-subunit alcohol dehydrogenase family)